MVKMNPVCRRTIDVGGQKMIVDFFDFLKVWKKLEKDYKKNLSKKGEEMIRAITPEDVVRESDKAYDMGRKHGHGERADLLDWAESLILKSSPPNNCSSKDWGVSKNNWLNEKRQTDKGGKQ